LVDTDRLEIVDLSRAAATRAARLMDEYADRPMDLADATPVALAEDQGHHRVFTPDPDFHVYRLHGRRRFEVVPVRRRSARDRDRD